VVRIETRSGVEAFLNRIRDSLKSGEFEPVEVRQAMIPKPSGKLRKLGIRRWRMCAVRLTLRLTVHPSIHAG
jgi:RNA-directed DNA polymerase